jgi:hypothetical protein
MNRERVIAYQPSSIMSVEAYNVNFCFPVPETLENDRVKLTPFIVE